MNKCVLSLTVALALFGRVSAASAGPAVAAGSSHVVVLTDSGTVWAWGYNAYGQLGDGTTFTRVTPTSIAITGITAIAAGGQSTYALKTDGTIWAWGMNSSGQLGDGTTTNRTSPVAVSSLSSIIAIAAGGNHAMALKSDGTVWAWGWNVYGQIGDNSTTNRTTPVQVSTLGTSVQAIGAADTHSHATKTDGTVWAWGHNQLSEAGDGTTTSPRKVPVQTGSLSSMTRVDAGGSNGFAWDASNALKAWGWNGEGELGDGTTTNRANPVSISGMSTVVSLHGGLGHTVAAKADGSAWAWGLNTYGQIGDTTTTSRTAPVQVSALDSVVSISAGYYFSVAVSSDGRVWTWGNNSEGQLGDGTYATRKAPVQLSDASFAWRVATPTLGPAGGSFTANVTVTGACVTPAATIHYTTNGVDPTDSDPTIATGSTVAVTQTTTLKAKAWLAGMPASSMASATYTLTVVAPSFSPFGTTYASAQNVTLSTTTGNATIRYTTDGTTPTASSPVYASPIAVSTGMTLKAIGLKTGWTTSAAATSTYTFNYGTLAAPVFGRRRHAGHDLRRGICDDPLHHQRHHADGVVDDLHRADHRQRHGHDQRQGVSSRLDDEPDVRGRLHHQSGDAGLLAGCGVVCARSDRHGDGRHAERGDSLYDERCRPDNHRSGHRERRHGRRGELHAQGAGVPHRLDVQRHQDGRLRADGTVHELGGVRRLPPLRRAEE